MTRALILSVVFLGFITTACGSASEAFCENQQQCGRGGKQSEAQCVANEQKRIDDMRAKPGCESVADSYELMLGCQGSLSCQDLSLEPKSSPCRREIESFTGSTLVNVGCYFK